MGRGWGQVGNDSQVSGGAVSPKGNGRSRGGVLCFGFGDVVSLVSLWDARERLSWCRHSRARGASLVAWAGTWKLEPWMDSISPEDSIAQAEQRAQIEPRGQHHLWARGQAGKGWAGDSLEGVAAPCPLSPLSI